MTFKTQTRGATYMRNLSHTTNPHADSPALAAYWRAFRETDGSDSKIGARLGVYRETIRERYRKPFLARFKANYLAVRMIRGKAA